MIKTAEGEQIVSLTDPAKKEVRRLLAEDGRPGLGLRLGVKGGGCSGLSYVVDFDVKKEGDQIQKSDGFEVFIDRKSSLYLKDVELHHEGGIHGKGFRFQNPNASNTCGCGESFSV